MTENQTITDLQRILNALASLPYTSIVAPPTAREIELSPAEPLALVATFLEAYKEVVSVEVVRAHKQSDALRQMKRDVEGVRRLLGIES